MPRAPRIPLTWAFLCLAIGSKPALPQDEIRAIPFDSIPAGTSFVAGSQPIQLEADTNVSGSLVAAGEVSTNTGVRYPDGTVQTTADRVGAGITANAGLYSNTIPEVTPSLAYTEVCIKSDGVSFDIHDSDEPTTGGNCVPGDKGWIIERFERDAGAAQSWTSARMECLISGMRLLEPFEWQFSCENQAEFAVSDLQDDWEWTGNSVSLIRIDTSSSFGSLDVPIMGNGSCTHGTHGTLARNDGAFSGPYQFRCGL